VKTVLSQGAGAEGLRAGVWRTLSAPLRCFSRAPSADYFSLAEGATRSMEPFGSTSLQLKRYGDFSFLDVK